VNRSSIESLIPIQELDSKVNRLRSAISNLDEVSGLKDVKTQFNSLRLAYKTLKDEFGQLQARHAALEEQSKSLLVKVRNMKAQESSGAISHRDIAMTETEISKLDAQRSSLEDEELEILADMENKEAKLAELEVSLGDLSSKAKELSAKNDLEVNSMSAEMDELLKSRSELIQSVDPKLLAMYDTIQPRVGAMPVARIENSTCQGCKVRMSASEIESIKKLLSSEFSSPATCEQCGRILLV
jgi:predicted  nucleic acid-binding Zn-ribbon protein